MTIMHALTALLAVAAAQDVRVEESDELLSVTYGWPAAVEQEPELRSILQSDANAMLVQGREWAETDRAERGGGAPFNGHSHEKVWVTAGSTPQLLSLAADYSSYTGGVHGSLIHEALLWDRLRGRRLDPIALFGLAAVDGMEARFCAQLDDQRAERREAPVVRDAEDLFSACLPLVEQVLAPADENGDGRFDTLRVLVAPYAAGPWSEGSYIVDVGFEPADLTGLPAPYAPAFESAAAPTPARNGSGERG